MRRTAYGTANIRGKCGQMLCGWGEKVGTDVLLSKHGEPWQESRSFAKVQQVRTGGRRHAWTMSLGGPWVAQKAIFVDLCHFLVEKKSRACGQTQPRPPQDAFSTFFSLGLKMSPVYQHL